jgi:hypothetical protein
MSSVSFSFSFYPHPNSFDEKLVLENVAFSFYLIGRPRYTFSGLAAPIFDFRLGGTSYSFVNSSLGKRVLRNVGVAVVFSILRTIQAKIQQLLCSNCDNISVSDFVAAILDSWIALGFSELHCFVA